MSPQNNPLSPWSERARAVNHYLTELPPVVIPEHLWVVKRDGTMKTKTERTTEAIEVRVVAWFGTPEGNPEGRT